MISQFHKTDYWLLNSGQLLTLISLLKMLSRETRKLVTKESAELVFVFLVSYGKMIVLFLVLSRTYIVLYPWYRYFSMMLERLCSCLYDVFRPLIIHINHLETLAELCSILKIEMLEEHVQNNRKIS